MQRRLHAAGVQFEPSEVGVLCAATGEAIRRFQQRRGLRATGECDEDTWTALVEASWALGDRLILLTSPNLRGDDVAALQSALARLGFDSGRVDGIFGPKTAQALHEFQSNCGMANDGVCGPDTVRTVRALLEKSGNGPGVSVIRERERLHHRPGSITRSRVVVGHFGGLSILSRDVTRHLRGLGAAVISLDEPDAFAQANAANRFEADLYVGFETAAEQAGTTVHYYRVPAFESAGGRSLAELIAAGMCAAAVEPVTVSGMRLPVLRETRMPAVLVVIGAVRETMDRSPELATVVGDAVQRWTSRRA